MRPCDRLAEEWRERECNCRYLVEDSLPAKLAPSLVPRRCAPKPETGISSESGFNRSSTSTPLLPPPRSAVKVAFKEPIRRPVELTALLIADAMRSAAIPTLYPPTSETVRAELTYRYDRAALCYVHYRAPRAVFLLSVTQNSLSPSVRVCGGSMWRSNAERGGPGESVIGFSHSIRWHLTGAAQVPLWSRSEPIVMQFTEH